ncbi:MAG: heavy metal translocating P-type ATPase [Armatimonadota bacterium]|nr:heavy metal translocating P-type ATPase [Armatimonadota bacterium]
MPLKSLELPITGISCAACATRIERGVLKVAGIAEAGVNCATNVLTVKYDPAAVSPRELIKTITDLGYGAGVRTVTLPVEGMRCASCIRRIEGGLESLDGVMTAEVNFAAGNVTVNYIESRVGPADMERAITGLGYSVPAGGEAEEKPSERMKSPYLVRLIGAAALTIPILLGSLHHMFRVDVGPLSNPLVLLVLATPVQLWAAWPFYRGAWAATKQRTSDMNTLIAIGSSTAYLYSVALALFPGLFASARGAAQALYFDTSAVIVTLILLGRHLELTAKGRASDAIRKLSGLQARMARVLREDVEIDLPIEEIQMADRIVVRPGERIPADGIVAAGSSVVDESIITGESIPVTKEPGDEVIGATINKMGSFTFRATRVGRDTVLAQIIRMVEEAQGSKAPVQRLADRISAYFVPVVMAIAALTFALWYLFGPEPRLTYALLNLVAVLIVACPCALGLATPTAIIVGTGKGAERGILIKGGEALEIAHKLTAVVLDKTGTLTTGRPDVTDVVAVDMTQDDLLRLTASAERRSEHPLAEAIVRASQDKGLTLEDPTDFSANAGHGVEAVIGERRVVVGNERMIGRDTPGLEALSISAVEFEESGKTVVFVAVDGKAEGFVACADRLKPDAADVMAALARRGLKLVMMTGDNERAAKALASEAGITEVFAQALPQEKADYVGKLRKQGEVVAMVGDGINDSPALAAADLGVAIGAGTDIAMEASDITLIGEDLSGILTAIRLSQRTMAIVKQNLFWAFFYNVLLIPMAAGAFYPAFGVFLNPMLAAAAMAVSSVTVVANSLRLKRFK